MMIIIIITIKIAVTATGPATSTYPRSEVGTRKLVTILSKAASNLDPTVFESH